MPLLIALSAGALGKRGTSFRSAGRLLESRIPEDNGGRSRIWQGQPQTLILMSHSLGPTQCGDLQYTYLFQESNMGQQMAGP